MRDTFPILPPSPSDVTRLVAAGIAQPKGVPWDMLAPHAERMAKNHGGQSMETIADRGGLDAGELVAVLRDWSFQLMKVEASYLQLNAELQAWRAGHGIEEETDGA